MFKTFIIVSIIYYYAEAALKHKMQSKKE